MNALSMLFGAALVALGVIAAALADRIRGLRIAREAANREPRERAGRAPSVAAQPARVTFPVESAEPLRAPAPKQPRARNEPKVTASTEVSEDVIAALVAAGYRRATATQAVAACSHSDQSSLENWTRAALRHAGAS